MKFLKPLFICEARRTAIGSFGGGLSGVSAIELGSLLVRDIVERSKLSSELIQEVIVGCVLSSGLGQAPARQVALKGGLPNTVQAMAVNKVCSSGLKAVQLGCEHLELGISELVIAGGVENMSLAPYLLPHLRSGARLGDDKALDSIIKDALWDPYHDYHMGNAAELCSRKFGFSREQQDEYASESYRRAIAGTKSGEFKSEITAVEIKSKKGTVTFDEDEEPKRFRPEKLSQLKPAFDKQGTVTAANASSINDGASLLLLASEKAVKEHALTPLARVVSEGWHAREPEWFTVAPVGAVKKAVQDSGKAMSEIDLFEINEAFAAVAMACSTELDISSDKLNISGGAVALGHPVGASGARILTTLIHALKRQGKKWGAVGICNGGGEATSLVIEIV